MTHKKFTSIFIFISSRSSSVKSGLSKIFIQAVFARFSVPIKILQKYFLSFRHGLIKLPSMDLERKLSSSSSAICLSSDMSTFANQLAKRHSSFKNHEKKNHESYRISQQLELGCDYVHGITFSRES